MKHRRPTLTSEKLVRQKRKKRRFFWSLLFGSVLIIGAILFFIFRSPLFIIEDIFIEGNEIVDAESVKKLVNDILASNYFAVIPKRNKLVYPQKEIESEVRKQVGRVETISLNIDKKVLSIKIGERGSYALWCKNDTECFFMDKNGFIFSESPVFSSGVYKVFTGVVSAELPIGQQFLDEEKLADIKMLTDFLLNNGWNTERIEVKTVRDVLLVQQKGPKIKIDLTKSITNTLTTLKTLLASPEFKKSAKDIASLEYIDARFGSKIFFKPKGDLLPASAIAPSL